MFDFAHKISFPYYTTLCMNKERKESCFNCSGFTELLLLIYRINNSHPADSRAGCCLERSAISSLSRPQAPAKPTGTLTDTGNALNCFHFPPKAPAVPFCDTPCFPVYLLICRRQPKMVFHRNAITAASFHFVAIFSFIPIYRISFISFLSSTFFPGKT